MRPATKLGATAMASRQRAPERAPVAAARGPPRACAQPDSQDGRGGFWRGDAGGMLSAAALSLLAVTSGSAPPALAAAAPTEERQGYVMLERKRVESMVIDEFTSGLAELSDEELTGLLEDVLRSRTRSSPAQMLGRVEARARQAPSPSADAPGSAGASMRVTGADTRSKRSAGSGDGGGSVAGRDSAEWRSGVAGSLRPPHAPAAAAAVKRDQLDDGSERYRNSRLPEGALAARQPSAPPPTEQRPARPAPAPAAAADASGGESNLQQPTTSAAAAPAGASASATASLASGTERGSGPALEADVEAEGGMDEDMTAFLLGLLGAPSREDGTEAAVAPAEAPAAPADGTWRPGLPDAVLPAGVLAGAAAAVAGASAAAQGGLGALAGAVQAAGELAGEVAGSVSDAAGAVADSDVGGIAREVAVPVALVALGTAGVVAIGTLVEGSPADGAAAAPKDAASSGQAQAAGDGGQAAAVGGASSGAPPSTAPPAAADASANGGGAASSSPDLPGEASKGAAADPRLQRLLDNGPLADSLAGMRPQAPPARPQVAGGGGGNVLWRRQEAAAPALQPPRPPGAQTPPPVIPSGGGAMPDPWSTDRPAANAGAGVGGALGSAAGSGDKRAGEVVPSPWDLPRS